MILNQPNNSLVNHLGTTNNWYSYITNINKFVKYSAFNYVSIMKYLHILFKNGIIYLNHLFYSKFYFNIKSLITLPSRVTKLTFSKFYRIHKIKSMESRIKKNYIMRRYMEYINLSSLFFFKHENWIIVVLYIYIPFVKRLKYVEYSGDEEKRINENMLLLNYYNYHLRWFTFKNLF